MNADKTFTIIGVNRRSSAAEHSFTPSEGGARPTGCGMLIESGAGRKELE
jgi:hypothetical protein